MNFFLNYIGLDVPGDSGLALTGLPGITLTNFAAMKEVGKDNQSVWEKIQKRALLKLGSLSLARLNECFKINDGAIVNCLVLEKKALFATALWYLLGAETMIERIYSDRVNRWTTIDKPEAQELSSYYATQFENELQYAINGISPNESPCLEKDAECTGDRIRFETVCL